MRLILLIRKYYKEKHSFYVKLALLASFEFFIGF